MTDIHQMNKDFKATVPFKAYMGYREMTRPMITPATREIGNSIERSRGPAQFQGTLCNRPIFRDPDIRLANRLQRLVVDTCMTPQSTDNGFTRYTNDKISMRSYL